MNESKATRAALMFALCLTTAAPVHASLFQVDVNNGAIVARDNDVIALIDRLIEQKDEFVGLGANPNYSVSLDYLGVKGAILLDVSNFGSDVVLGIPSIGTVVSFSATTPFEVGDQIEEYIEKEGAAMWAAFTQAMRARTPLAALDGNPAATTSLFANSAFRRFGLHDESTRLGYREQEVTRFSSFRMSVEVGGGSISTPGFDDLSSIDGSIEIAGDLGETLGLSFALVGQLRDYQGAEIYDAAVELGLPIHLQRPTRGDNLYWAVTPFLQVGAGVAEKLAAGGLVIGGGVVNAMAMQMGPFEVSMANELVYYGGVPIKNVGGFDFETKLDQIVMKNGGKLAFHLNSMLRAEAGLVFTNFLVDEAAVDFYSTPFLGAGLRLGRHFDLRGRYEADLGKNDYRANRGRLELAVAF